MARRAGRSSMYKYVLLLHVLGATIWTGGHLVLAVRILPRALRLRSAGILLDFEKQFEPIGMTALIVQVLTGLWLSSRLVPLRMWLVWNNHASQLISIKLGLLAMTIGLALIARFRVIPRLHDENVASMGWLISLVTLISVLLATAGVGIRTGGWW